MGLNSSIDNRMTKSALGTPAYMSPEQASGDLNRLGPRSDVYSLGATLYCLLTANPPFSGNDIGQVLRKTQRCEFAPPRRIDTSIDKALEAVCLKAMAREPEDRYASCRALAEDVERWLADEPVSAWAEPWSRTLLRWLTRHRTGVTGAVAALLAGVFGLSAVLAVQTTANARLSDALTRETAANSRVTAANAELTAASAVIEQAGRQAEARRVDADAQRKRAEASYALARKAVDESFTQVSESTLLDVPGLRPLRRGLLQSALTFYEEFRRRGGDDPAVLADLAATQARVGQILADLSEREKARVALRRAVELYDKTLAARPNVMAALERLSEVWHRLGDLDYRMDRAPASAAYRKAIAIRERLAAAHPAEPRFRMALSRSLNGLALTTEPAAEQLDAYRRSLELRLKLADEIPEDPDLLHGLSESFPYSRAVNRCRLKESVCTETGAIQSCQGQDRSGTGSPTGSKSLRSTRAGWGSSMRSRTAWGPLNDPSLPSRRSTMSCSSIANVGRGSHPNVISGSTSGTTPTSYRHTRLRRSRNAPTSCSS
jgi:serine/threonine-protein kinase